MDKIAQVFIEYHILDIIIISMLILFALNGYRNGFLRSLISIMSMFLASFIAILCCGKVAEFLGDKLHLMEDFSSFFEKKLLKVEVLAIEISSSGIKEALLKSGMPEFFAKSLASMIEGMISKTQIPMGTTLAKAISPALANYTLQAISFTGLLIVIKIVFSLITKNVIIRIEEKQEEGEEITRLSRISGMIVSLLYATIILFIVTFIVSALNFSFFKPIVEIFNSSFMASVFFNENMLGKIVDSFTNSDYIKKKIIEFVN